MIGGFEQPDCLDRLRAVSFLYTHPQTKDGREKTFAACDDFPFTNKISCPTPQTPTKNLQGGLMMGKPSLSLWQGRCLLLRTRSRSIHPGRIPWSFPHTIFQGSLKEQPIVSRRYWSLGRDQSHLRSRSIEVAVSLDATMQDKRSNTISKACQVQPVGQRRGAIREN